MDILAGYEKIHSVIGCVVVTIFGFIMIGVAIHLLVQPVRKASVEGIVKSYNPQTKMMNVTYKIANNTYFLNTTGNVGVGGSVIILYDSNNPSNARLDTQISNKTLAIILLTIAIIIMFLTYLTTYFVFKSNTYATIAGGFDIANQLSGMLA